MPRRAREPSPLPTSDTCSSSVCGQSARTHPVCAGGAVADAIDAAVGSAAALRALNDLLHLGLNTTADTDRCGSPPLPVPAEAEEGEKAEAAQPVESGADPL